MPFLKKRFLYAAEFAKASLEDLFSAQKLSSAQLFTADYFSNAVLINKGNFQFETQALPWNAQLTSFKDAVIVQANEDSLPDVFLVGNFYENNIDMGRYDADYGTLLINKGNGVMEVSPVENLSVRGEVRHIHRLKTGNQQTFILARNNDSAMIIQFGRH